MISDPVAVLTLLAGVVAAGFWLDSRVPLGRLARLDIATLAVASQAAIGGPSSAVAVAIGREWRPLVLPGIILGLLGYAVGNYLGFGVAYLVRGLGLGL